MIIKRVEQVYEEWYFCDDTPCMFGIFENEDAYAFRWIACFTKEEDANLFLKIKETS